MGLLKETLSNSSVNNQKCSIDKSVLSSFNLDTYKNSYAVSFNKQNIGFADRVYATTNWTRRRYVLRKDKK